MCEHVAPHSLTAGRDGRFGKAFQDLLRVPKWINRVSSLHISCGRIAAYLNAPELENKRTTQNKTSFRNVTATWKAERHGNYERQPFHLWNVSINFVSGALNLVTGPLGSGKSALLLTILGETTVLQGEVIAPRSTPQTLPTLCSPAIEADPHTKAEWLQPSIAYTPQVAFIEHGTVRSNISSDRYSGRNGTTRYSKPVV